MAAAAKKEEIKEEEPATAAQILFKETQTEEVNSVEKQVQTDCEIGKNNLKASVMDLFNKRSVGRKTCTGSGAVDQDISFELKRREVIFERERAR